MEEGLLREVGQECFQGFKDDEDSRGPWLDMHAYWLSLYMQSDYAENGDAERDWGATESVPILKEACDQFQARTYKAFFPSDTFISAISMRKTRQDRKETEARAKRIGDHMSYQLGYEDRTYRMDKDGLFLGAAVHGSFFTKAYFNEQRRRAKVDNVRPTDLVINYNIGPIRIEDVRRKSHIIYTNIGDTARMADTGFLLSEARACQQMGDNVYNVKVDEVLKMTEPNFTLRADKPAILIEQHLFLDLDGQGFKPYVVTFDLADRSVKRIIVGYEADSKGNPLKDFEQTQYFTHYKYQENPDGFYGLGLGQAVGDLNGAINIMLRQTMDAGTLANDGNMSGFISERLGIEGDEVRAVLGKLRKIPDTIGDFQNSIMLMKFPGPNEALIKIMVELDKRAQRMASTTEATTGGGDKVIQPTTYLAQVEQALEQFTSVQMRLANSMSEELQKIYAINQKYLPVISYYTVNGVPETITRADYADDMLVQPVFDPRQSTTGQKVARAQAELQATMQNPVNQGRPAVYDAAFKRYLEALDVDDIDELIPPQPQVENFDNQILENMFFLFPSEARPLFDVFPEQNHQEHLILLEQFVQQYGQGLQPDQIEAVMKHQMKHQGYLYGQQNGLVPLPPPNSPPTPPLAVRNGMQQQAISPPMDMNPAMMQNAPQANQAVA